jgi:integrase
MRAPIISQIKPSVTGVESSATYTLGNVPNEARASSSSSQHVDVLHGTINVRESVSEVRGHLVEVGTKTGERRTVPLPRFLCDVLGEHLGEYSSLEGHVFTSPEGKPLRRNNFMCRHFKPALRRAGLDHATRFHDLRHSAASIAINGGASVRLVQQMLGHSTAMLTLDTYSHVWESKEQQLRDDLDKAWAETEPEEERYGGPSTVVPLHDA